ncbi:MAG: cupin domain-containing protein [Thermomicrobiales bacterium]
MPLFRDGMASAPDWCELRSFEVVELAPGERREFARTAPRERLLVAGGACRLAFGGREVDGAEGTKVELAGPDDHFAVNEVREPTTVVHLCGRWGEETGGWGIFRVREVEDATDKGDPVDYPKRTTIDSHYHDCDECYIILEGRGTVVSEGKHYEVGPGDCVATGMGHHHDFPLAPEPVKAVYFETTLAGERRRGHLWNHTHGVAQPMPGRE